MRAKDYYHAAQPKTDLDIYWSGRCDEFLARAGDPELQARLAARSDKSPVEVPNGPAPPNILWWNGVPHALQPRPWDLLRFLWDNRKAKADAVLDEVWGCNTKAGESAIRTAVSRLNEVLLRDKIPLIASCKAGYVTLDTTE